MTYDVKRQYLDFLIGSQKNAWLGDDHLHVYVRKGHHLMNDRALVETIDIGNVSNAEYDGSDEMLDKRYRQGHFRDFMKFVEEHNPYGVIYVESVISKRMDEILQKNGYIPSTVSEHCYIKYVGTYRI